jgi:uncharacterized damage-inducible protein DinB
MFESTLVELYYGRGAHASPIACVEDLSAELAGRHMDGFPHSIWQLLGHMNYWMDYELRRIRGDAPVYPEHASGSWPSETAPASDAAWLAEVARSRDLIARLAGLARSDPSALSREVPTFHAQQTQLTRTIGAVLWQTMAHNSYHVGQIAMMRRCLGSWPPAAGGDTW